MHHIIILLVRTVHDYLLKGSETVVLLNLTPCGSFRHAQTAAATALLLPSGVLGVAQQLPSTWQLTQQPLLIPGLLLSCMV